LRFRMCDPIYPNKCVAVEVPREVVLNARSLNDIVDYIQDEMCRKYRSFAYRFYGGKVEVPQIEAMASEYCRKIRLLIMKWVVETIKWGRVERR